MALPSSQKAIRIHETGGPEVIRYEDVPVPEVSDTDVLLKNSYGGVNFIEAYFRKGLYKAPLPMTLGREAAGQVAQVGAKVKNFKVGDRVAYSQAGAFAQYTVVAENGNIVKIPANLSEEKAAASLIQGLTAYTMLKESYEVKKGDTILVHAAAGGTGAMIVQFGKLFGATVIGTTSSPEKAKIAKEAGADVVINYRTEDVIARVLEITNGKGVEAVFDSVGADTWDISTAVLAKSGTLVSFGNASGPVPLISLLSLPKNIKITRPTLFNVITDAKDRDFYTAGLFDLLAKGTIKINISKVYPLSDFATATTDLEGGKTTGKLLLKLD